MKQGFVIFAFTICCTNLWAQVSSIEIKINKKSDDKVSQIQFEAPDKHHFNNAAPNEVKALVNKHWVEAIKIQIDGRILTASFKKKVDPCAVRTNLFVCDDANTYCIPKKQDFTCGHKLDEKSSDIEETTKTEPSERPGLFIQDDPATAIAKARELKKPLMIDFYGVWCPPCNQLNETVFNTQLFENAAKKFVLLKLDADKKVSWELKSKFKISGYPTVVFATSDLDEIGRIVGERPVSVFVKMMDEMAQRKAPKTDYELGLLELDRKNFKEAELNLLMASQNWSAKDQRRDKLMTAVLGVYSEMKDDSSRRVYARLLEQALNWYPRSSQSIDRAGDLANVYLSLGDKEKQRKALELQIEKGKWFQSHPKSKESAELDYTSGDFDELFGWVYEQLGDSSNAKAAYNRAAQEYLQQIKDHGLSEETERGYNLERLYCLWKSGAVDMANVQYEKLEEKYSSDFTFYYQQAHLLKEAGRLKEALAKAEKALSLSYGDNKLRVADYTAKILLDMKDKPKAVALVDRVLSEAQLPDDKEIRTHRYYEKLVEVKKSLEKP